MSQKLHDILLAESENNKDLYLPHISIDSVVFGFDGENLHVLLTKMIGKFEWMLPGGYVFKEENINSSAHRILQERTGAENIFLSQFKTYGATQRSEDAFTELPEDLWHKQRYISIAYYALTRYDAVNPRTDKYSDSCAWQPVEQLPEIMMDHKGIIEDALMYLRRDLNYKPVGLNLLPQKFTMPELQRLYEIILDKSLNRGNFYRKMTRYNILEKLNETRRGGAHKAPDLYTFNLENYNAALENGLQESW